MLTVDDRITAARMNIVPPGPVSRPTVAGGTPAAGRQAGRPFAAALDEAVAAGRIKFSQHAQQRLQVRNIELGPGDLEAINRAIDLAAAKGSRDSLVLYRDLALIVSVRNRTVVTAIDGQRMKENVFTNIDSAVIV